MTANTRNIGLADESAAGLDQAAGFTRSLAVVIGIDDYAAPIPRLKTPGNDARGIQDVLARQQQFTVLPPLTEDVTHSRLLELFTVTLPGLNLGPSDRLLVYFAGHGTEMSGAGGEPEYYLVPQDARPDDRDSFLPMRLVRDALLKLQCRHLLLVLDCCFAGGFGRMRSLDDLPPKIYRQRFDFYVSSPAWQVIASAAHDETALDTAGGYVFGRRAIGAETEHSPFASALFDALEGQADVNPASQEGEPAGDGLITAAELYVWIRDRVQAVAGATHRQSPGLWPLPNHEAGEFVFRNPERALSLEDALPLTAGANPYRGLSSYDEAQSHLFFGRAKQIAALTEKVAAEPFVAVLGVSGTGKSSLAKAGLIPTLGGSHRAGDPPEPRQVGEMRWLTLPPFRPTAEPVASLTRLLTDHLPTYMNQVPAPASDATALAALVTAWRADHPGARLALVIDQFEELVTLCADKAQRQHFQALLANALAAAGDSLRVIITLRTDFEPQYNQGVLKPFWHNEARYVVLPMSQDELRQVILGPAWASEIYFESRALVDALINEVVQAPGGLPLLSFALSEMYLRYITSGRQDRTLRQADFDAVGGVIGSLRAAANAIWDGLDPAHQATMERLMLRMIAIGGGEVARRRVAWAELDYDEPENTRRDAVIGQLKEARLVVRDEGAGWVEPAHDALVSGWDKLTEWKFTAASYLPLQRDLAPAALRWQAADAKAKAGLLWDDDPRLPQVEETLWPTDGEGKGLAGRIRWARQVLAPQTKTPTDTKWLNRPELSFVQSSVQARTRFWQRSIGIGLAILLVVGILLAFGFNQQQQSAANAKDAAANATVAANEQVLRATSDANATVAVANEAAAKVAEATAVSEAYVRATAQAQESQARATAELARATAVAAQAETERLKRSIEADQLTANGLKLIGEDPPQALLLAVEGLRVHNDVSETLTIRSRDHITATDFVTVTVTRPETSPNSALTNIHRLLEQIRGIPLIGHQAELQDVAFSPDGHWLATASRDRTVRLWSMVDKAAQAVLLEGHLDVVGTVAFSPDGTQLASASADQTVRLWNMENLSAKPVVFADASEVMAFSPDGKWLAAASLAGDVRLWEVENPERVPIILEGHADKVRTLAFSPNGRWLASGSMDFTARLWSMADPTATPIVLEHTDQVLTLSFSPDSHWLATGSLDDTARVWNTSDFAAKPLLLSHDERAVNVVAFSPNSRWLATGTGSALMGMVRMWDLENPQNDPVQFADHGYFVQGLAFSSDRHWLAAGSIDFGGARTVRLWDLSRLTADPTMLVGQEYAVFALEFSPDARWLATGSADAKAVLWDLQSTIEPKVLRGHIWTVTDLAFSRDGRWLASVSFDGGAFLWNLENGEGTLLTLQENKDISHIGFTPDGRWLLTALTTPQEGTIRVWDLASDSPRAFALKGSDGPVVALTSSEDASWIAASFADTSVRIWPSSDFQSPPIFLNGHNGPVQAIAFSSDGRWLATGSMDKTIHLWNVANLDKPPLVLSGHEDSIASVVFSVDGRWLASRSSDNMLHLWDVADPSTAIIEQRNVEEDGLFSPDGHWFLADVAQETARIWNLTAPGIPAVDLPEVSNVGPFGPDGHWVLLQKTDNQSVQLLNMTDVDAPPKHLFYALGDEHWQFSSDSWWLAGAVGDLARIWSVTNPESYPIEIRGQYEGVTSVAFSMDGRRLAMGAGDGNIRVYTWQVQDLIDLACNLAGENFSQQEWEVWFGSQPYHRTCPQWPARASP